MNVIKKNLYFFFAISFILIAIFINEVYDDETFYGNDDEKKNLNFLEMNKKYVMIWYS